jgi:hypothetical protein
MRCGNSGPGLEWHGRVQTHSPVSRDCRMPPGDEGMGGQRSLTKVNGSVRFQNVADL